MIAVSLGLFAALCWAFHDLLARNYAPRSGPWRMALWVILIGALLLLLPVGFRNAIWEGDSRSFLYAGALGLSYAFALGGLFKAFSLAPVSIVGPFTAPYPALVVLWGLFHGLVPSVLDWLAIILIVLGAVVVARFGHEDGGLNAVAKGKIPQLVIACGLALVGFAAAVVFGQEAAIHLGEVETTFISRFPAAVLILPMALAEGRSGLPLPRATFASITVMALLDVLAVSAINYAGHFDNKEFAAMAITSYGALAVLLAMILLKEQVSLGQWTGIAMIAAGVSYLGYAGT